MTGDRKCDIFGGGYANFSAVAAGSLAKSHYCGQKRTFALWLKLCSSAPIMNLAADDRHSPEGYEATSSVSTRADELFLSLDGRCVVADGLEWQLEILGIHFQGERCWIQVAARSISNTQCSATFEIEPDYPEGLLASTRTWLTSSAETLARFTTSS